MHSHLAGASSSLSFALLHAGNCSPHLSPRPGSSALEKFYFFNGGKSQSYIELKIPVVDACLPESPAWSVVFPVVMPVSFAVCSKAVHIHLGWRENWCYRRESNCTSTEMLNKLFILSVFTGSSTWGPPWCPKLFCCMTRPQRNSPRSTQGTWHPKLCWDTPRPELRGKRRFLPINSCLAIWKHIPIP